MRLVYSLPGIQLARVRRDEVYKTVGDLALAYDVYYPPDFVEGEQRPCVVFIHGEGPAEILKNAKDWGQYVSWGQLAAASGLIGVTFNHRSSEWFTNLPEVASDVDDLMSHVRQNAAGLGIDDDRFRGGINCDTRCARRIVCLSISGSSQGIPRARHPFPMLNLDALELTAE